MFAYEKFLDEVIKTGIEAAKVHYTKPDQQMQLDGSLAGFEACRNKTPTELKHLLIASAAKTRGAYTRQAPDYWKLRCFELEVEWVCNVVSALLVTNCQPGIISITARAAIHAAEITQRLETET